MRIIKAAIDYLNVSVSEARLDPFFKHKRYSETISFSDTVSIEYNYGVSAADIVGLADTSVLSTGKGLVESVSFADAIVVTWTISRTVDDTITLVDNLTSNIAGLSTYNEVATMADAVALVFTKSLGESFSMVDVPVMDIGSTRTDTVSMGDLATNGVGKALAETLSMGDNATILTLNIESSVLNHSVLGAFAFNQ